MPLRDTPVMLLQPTENSVRADPALQALIGSTAAYAGPRVGVDDLRANNAAKVYLSICLGLQEAGVLSIQHVPALWIDIGDQAYKTCFHAPGNDSESNEDQPFHLSGFSSDERSEDSSRPIQSKDARCMQVRNDVKRNQHMAVFLTAIENLVNNIDFSIAPLTVQYTCITPSTSTFPKAPSLDGPQELEVDPIRRVALRLYRLQQLEKQGDKLSLYTNNAYYAVGKAYSDATEAAASGSRKSDAGRSKQLNILRQLATYEGLGHLTSREGRAAWSKRIQRAHKFCLMEEIFGIDILHAVPAVSVSKLEKITIGKLIEVRDGGLYQEEVCRIKIRLTRLIALRASIFNID